MGIQPILPITVPFKKMKGAARQCYVDGDGVVRCEQTLSMILWYSRERWAHRWWRRVCSIRIQYRIAIWISSEISPCDARVENPPSWQYGSNEWFKSFKKFPKCTDKDFLLNHLDLIWLDFTLCKVTFSKLDPFSLSKRLVDQLWLDWAAVQVDY